MTMQNDRRAFVTYAGAVALGAALPASAETTFPNHPIRIVTPHSPGSSSDTLSRAIAQQMSANLKSVAVTVENREGAAGVVAANYVKGVAPDGYTILMTVPALVFAPLMQSKPTYDFAKAFTPILQVAENPYILFSSAAAPFKTFPELVAYAKANPTKVSYAGSGKGGQPHLGTEVLKKLYGFPAQEVQYKKVSDAVIDMVAGRMDIFLVNIPPVRAQLADGTIRAIAVASPKRLTMLPDVPTFAEFGKPFDYAAWFALVAPAGTPPDVVAKLSDEIAKAVQAPAVRRTIEEVLTGEVAIKDSKTLGRLIEAEAQRYGQLISELGLKE